MSNPISKTFMNNYILSDLEYPTDESHIIQANQQMTEAFVNLANKVYFIQTCSRLFRKNLFE